jgi:hypothetical protein
VSLLISPERIANAAVTRWRRRAISYPPLFL